MSGGPHAKPGRFLPAHRTALNNVRAAFPEKSDEEHRAIVRASWDNLGRVAGEYAHLGQIFDYDAEADKGERTIVEGIEHFLALRDDGRPGLIFSAHLANWELPAICAARYGLEANSHFPRSQQCRRAARHC